AVLGDVRLGRDRKSKVRFQTTGRDEKGLQPALPVHYAVRAGTLLQQSDGAAMDSEAGSARVERGLDRGCAGVAGSTKLSLMKLSELRVACPSCGSEAVAYTCQPECCFNHVCESCLANFELATEVREGSAESAEAP